ncbi:hypothetical protein LPU83_pLPU83c_0383 (plasmid) [Rhizobium favelukesii]|uniref:Uncharacterized protein n=1 Tax=Rhizobium favelukesii TaxID=348824 RepID=W6RL15_9HYPH|nr:hypothetical protein LPU83_pLPU83c_0383 [Rhizobium favelukesii]
MLDCRWVNFFCHSHHLEEYQTVLRNAARFPTSGGTDIERLFDFS